MSVTLTGDWYDTQIGVMELYIKLEFKLVDETTVLIVPEQWQQKTFTFIVPVLSTASNGNMPVSVIITATNRIDKSATLTKAVVIDNSLNDNFRYSLYSSKTEYSDLQSVALLGAQMKLK
eukprot:CAMPEP_0168327920 /NCGR_PEP_ID=MMETSP0213-20121227/6169_1 /TAXON_ID=151035 /ORGANISM="Euplotes harpa, Strain FSP1.4" /LENGTH=119 /DNA_ID=CAMNT_0008330885 /DNA_START=218 /DNA_END=577 /DNA_ORIENTATION=+